MYVKKEKNKNKNDKYGSIQKQGKGLIFATT